MKSLYHNGVNLLTFHPDRRVHFQVYIGVLASRLSGSVGAFYAQKHTVTATRKIINWCLLLLHLSLFVAHGMHATKLFFT
jgi:hypothetical protein